jgi:hypothetical protein
MHIIAIVTAGALLIAVSGPAQAGPSSPVGMSAGSPRSIELVATKKKSETVTQKVERVWKDLVGYKFNVSMPVRRIKNVQRDRQEPGRRAWQVHRQEFGLLGHRRALKA